LCRFPNKTQGLIMPQLNVYYKFVTSNHINQ